MLCNNLVFFFLTIHYLATGSQTFILKHGAVEPVRAVAIFGCILLNDRLGVQQNLIKPQSVLEKKKNQQSMNSGNMFKFTTTNTGFIK